MFLRFSDCPKEESPPPLSKSTPFNYPMLGRHDLMSLDIIKRESDNVKTDTK